MRFLTSFEGREEKIGLMQNGNAGALSYFEQGVFQTHATSHGSVLQSARRIITLTDEQRET